MTDDALKLRLIEDPIEWAERAAQLMIDGATLGEVVEWSQLPRSVVLDRLATYKVMSQMLARAEAHGKVLGKAEKVQADNERRSGKFCRHGVSSVLDGTGRRVVHCSECTRYTIDGRHPNCAKCDQGVAIDDGLCIECAKAKAVEDARTPEERGLVRCLEAECRKWIKNPMRRVMPLSAAYYFCKEHQACEHPGGGIEVLATYSGQVRRSLSNMPIFDRDGDPIWVTREVEVIKVKLMEDSHLTNCITFLEVAAKRRCSISRIDESQWPELTGARFPHLVAECKRRDERLRCPCRDGVVSTVSETNSDGCSVTDVKVTEVLCDQCQVGRDRKAAKMAAELVIKDHAGKKAMTLKMAMVMVVGLIIGGALAPGSHIVEWFVGYLRAAGCIK